MSSQRRKTHLFEKASSEELVAIAKRLGEIVDAHKEQQSPEKITVVDTPFWIYPNVFNPQKGRASLLLVPYLHYAQEESVLDMGCGMGTYAIVSALHGAGRVVAVDSNPHAILCTKENVKLHHLEEKVEVREGSLFAPIGKDEQFDVIVSNPPFFCVPQATAPKGYIEQCFVDVDGKFMHGFLEGARKHLKKNGKIRMLYGKSGKVDEFEELIRTYHYTCTILATKLNFPDKFYVVELSLAG